ncbi:MAG: Acetyltransferases and hydrolases with the alpha/beta hydrolase fold protein, partial [Parcubacteria group bacterium Gr01-1014_91]
MLKTMRTRSVVSFIFTCILAFGVSSPVVQAASVILKTSFGGLETIPHTLLLPQTATKAGDNPTFQVIVHSPYTYLPTVSVDLSQFGVASPTTTPAGPGSPNYNSDSYYNFGPFSIGADITDGLKTAFVTVTDSAGDVATTTAQIIVDNIKPTVVLSDISFSTVSPRGGDYMYLSGKVGGTGSVARVSQITMSLTDESGRPVMSSVTGGSTMGYNYAGFNEELSASTDGSFSRVPVQLVDFGDTEWIPRATNFAVELVVYDEAANFSNGSLTVLVPKPPPPDPCAEPGACASNVLFLPGIEGSRLYRPDYNGGTDQLWEPNIDGDVQDLYMNADGSSTRFDVYAKERDVIDELPNGWNIYKSFIAEMNELESAGIINDWEPIAYDWRLSLDDILNYGNDVQGRIYYSGDLRATSTPYVIQELKHLAGTSKTGKVTIVAHSNGGLLVKRLTELLGPAESARLIDKMIFVAVPQVGTPMAISAGLHGYKQDHVFGLVTSKSTARTFAQNSPMEYHLLPSAQYFTYVDDPVVTFDAPLTDWISRYGSVIHSQSSLHQFLIDTFGRVDPQTGDINQPIQFNNLLLTNAETLHASLDNWTPPAGISLIQIAGWGVPKTVSGITYKKKDAGVQPEANFTVDGDGTVVVPSALWTSTSAGATNYWMNLRAYNSDHPFLSSFGPTVFNHSRILETDAVLNFIYDQINDVTKSLSDYVYLSTNAPANSDKRLRYALHSPLTLNLYDNEGRHTGVSTSTGQVEEQIPGTYYTEFGDVKYLFSDASTPAHVFMNGYADGTFTFNVDQYIGDALTASTTFKDIPTSPSTIVALNVESDISTLSPMQIDKNGDGIVDATLASKLNGTVTLDTTPPELQMTFSTTTKSISFIGTDDSGTATVTATTTYPALKKKQKEYRGIATTFVTARDESGNTTTLVYTEQLPSPSQRDTITLKALAYGSTGSPQATTTFRNSSIAYKWR